MFHAAWGRTPHDAWDGQFLKPVRAGVVLWGRAGMGGGAEACRAQPDRAEQRHITLGLVSFPQRVWLGGGGQGQPGRDSFCVQVMPNTNGKAAFGFRVKAVSYLLSGSSPAAFACQDQVSKTGSWQ